MTRSVRYGVVINPHSRKQGISYSFPLLSFSQEKRISEILLKLLSEPIGRNGCS